MPVYSYKCKNCGYQFDQRQRMSDAPLKECPVCEGTVRRIVNSVGIVFKGSGFYVTDNRNGSSKNGAGPASSSSSGSKSSEKDKKSDDTKSSKAKKTAETT
jgi:putative FmdB family regulatory protein